MHCASYYFQRAQMHLAVTPFIACFSLNLHFREPVFDLSPLHSKNANTSMTPSIFESFLPSQLPFATFLMV